MSKASRQSITLLAIIHGCFKSIEDYNIAGDAAPTILYGAEVSERVVRDYPETGDSNKNIRWVTQKMHDIDGLLNNKKSLYSMTVLTALSHQIITDLIEKVRDRKKLVLLNELEEIIYNVSDLIDPKKDQFDAYEESDRILKKLYKLLEFSR